MKRVNYTVQKIILAILVVFNFGCKQEKPDTKLNVLQFNIWQEGTVVENGYSAILDEVIRVDADLIALSEVRNYRNISLAGRLVKDLEGRGYVYYSLRSQDTGILSRYPIVEQEALFPVKNDQGSVTKAVVDVNGTEIAFYSAHLDYRHCSLYLPRGYDGSTWEKLDSVVTDTAIIAEYNLKSMRDEAIRTVIVDAEKEQKRGRLVLLGGDFNEPSHLDWTEATKEMFDHNDVVMEWHNTKVLEQAGFVDAYRKLYPNPVTHPGFTFPADNPLVDIGKLAWSPDADDRDRIDFIFYKPDAKITLKSVAIVGPVGSIVRNQRVPERTEDPIFVPQGIWPTDHKAVLATFELN